MPWRAKASKAARHRAVVAAASRPLLGAARGGWGGGVRLLAGPLAGDVVLDQEQVVPGALDDVEEVLHQRDLLNLLLDEPLHELLRSEVARIPRELEESIDLLAHTLLLLQRHPHRRPRIVVAGLLGLD